MNNDLTSAVQRVIQHRLSRLVGRLFECRWPWVKNNLIRLFIRWYQIDMSMFRQPAIQHYKSTNDFFLRKLKHEINVSEISADKIVSPVNGCISQMGSITGHTLLQAKQQDYTLFDLLAGDQAMVDLFQDGSFLTVYLAPQDYHWVHMPLAGVLEHTTYVPGMLFSVNSKNTQSVSQLFARNERVINLFRTQAGPMAIIQVGACLVGNIGTVWEGTIAPRTDRATIHRWAYQDKHYWLEKGIEMGYFKLGSTIILLFSKDSMTWDSQLKSGSRLTCGQSMGTCRSLHFSDAFASEKSISSR
jgi:phosphatidylserine decarboxylase